MIMYQCYNGCMKTPQDKLTVRFSSHLLDALRILAEKHKRSLNSEILWALQSYVDAQAKESKRAKEL